MANFTDQVAYAYKLYERGENLKAHQVAVDLYVQNEIPELSFLIGLIRFENKCPLPRGYAELWMNFMLESANEGYDPACQFLGNAYYSGNKVPKDYGKAFNWYTKAANKGDPFSLYMLGEMYSYGRYVNYDQVLADKYYEKAALLGCYDAQKLLAERCFYIDKKYNVAERLYKLLAENKSAPLSERVKAQSNLAFLYRGNNGFIKDDAKARYYSGLALKNGDKDEAIHYAVACFKGEGGPVDYKEAIYAYNIVAENGGAGAWAFLGVMYNNGGYGCTADYNKAFKCYDKGAELGVAFCYLALARYYFWGRAVSKDYNTAIFWCNKAIAKNVNGATELLKEINDTINKEEKEKREQKEKEDREKREQKEKEDRERREKEERERQLAKQKEEEKKSSNTKNASGKLTELLSTTALSFSEKEILYMQNVLDELEQIRQLNLDQKPIDPKLYMSSAFELAKRGDVFSQQQLANKFYRGSGTVKKDYQAAIYWYLKAAEQGDFGACSQIGSCFCFGYGVKENTNSCLGWWCLSTILNKKDVTNILWLARCYLGYFGIEKNIAEAKRWLAQAEKHGKYSDAKQIDEFKRELSKYE